MIDQLVAYQLGTGEVPGSNPGKGENFLIKITGKYVIWNVCVMMTEI